MDPWRGVEPTKKELILMRIRECRDKHNRKRQRFELLIRNSQFMHEFQRLQEARKHPDRGREESLKAQAEGNWAECIRFSEEYYENIFYDLCTRWGISRDWDMEDRPTRGPLPGLSPLAPKITLDRHE